MQSVSRAKWDLSVQVSRPFAAVLWLGLPAAGEASGPWRGQVVDADTGQPLEGVAVIAVWYRRPGGHPALPIGPMGLVGSAEAVTDARGRFTLPFRIFFNPGLFTSRTGTPGEPGSTSSMPRGGFVRRGRHLLRKTSSSNSLPILASNSL